MGQKFSTQLASNANVFVMKYGKPEETDTNVAEYHSFVLNTYPSLASRRMLFVIIGDHMNDEQDKQLLRFLKHDALVLNLGVIFITANKKMWTPKREQGIQQSLPQVTLLAVHLVTGTGLETTTMRYTDLESPPSTSTYASLPIDQLSAINVDDLPGLERLVLLPPENSDLFWSHRNEFEEELLRILYMVKTLKTATIPLDFFTGIKDVLEALKEHKQLVSLRLTMPTTFNLLDLDTSSQRLLEVALVAGLEPFPQLEELIVGRDLTSSHLFLGVARRMFDSQVDSADGQTVRFDKPARDLMYGRSFLPHGEV